MKKNQKKVKLRVKFDPRIPLSFTVYVDKSDASRKLLAAVNRVAHQYDIEVKVKPVGYDAPTLVPALFIQDKYFFTYAGNFSEQALHVFVLSARDMQRKLVQDWVTRNSGRPIVAPRPLYDTDAARYPGRLRLLMPSQYDLGFQQYRTDDIGYEVNQFTVEALANIGVDVLLFADAGIGDFIIYTGTKTREE